MPRSEIRQAAADIVRLAQVWIQDLISFLPAEKRARWTRGLGLHGPLIITLDPSGEMREVGASGELLPLQMITSQSQVRLLVLRINEALILKRRLELPLIAAKRIDTVLEHNLGTWTPFESADIYAAACPLIDASSRAILLQTVELRCALRAGVDDQIETLQRLRLDPDAIELGDVRFQLPRQTRKRLRRQKQSWLAVGLALLLLAQGIVGSAFLASYQRDEIANLEAARNERVAVLRRQAKLEKDSVARQESIQRISIRLQQSLSFSNAFQLLGAALPKDAVIREFEANRDRAEGHVVILGAAEMDIVSLLSKTGFYRVEDLNVQQSTEVGQRAFSAGFKVPPWTQTINPRLR